MVNKTDSDYRTISVRLPRQEFIDFDKICNETHSSKLRKLISKEIKNSSKSDFLSGINKIKYNKLNNSFSWIVQLDSGQEVEILNNFSLEFLKNLQSEIQEAIKERNQWVHQTKDDSVDIPGELVGGKNERI